LLEAPLRRFAIRCARANEANETNSNVSNRQVLYCQRGNVERFTVFTLDWGAMLLRTTVERERARQ
jgi:hypothetical protein